MDIDSHYYAVLALCRMLGIHSSFAAKIAYVSQYVDDAIICRIYFKETPRGIRCHIFGKRRGLDKAASSPRIMTVWNYRPRVMIEELVPFHFIPAGRGKSLPEKIRTFPDSPLLKTLTEAAVQSGNIYEMGIILHVFADAYAHQGFSGIISRRNRLSGLKVKKNSIRGFRDKLVNYYMIYADAFISRLFGRFLPIYSHSHAGTLPDIASAEWEYRYDNGKHFIARFQDSGKIRNPERYRLAFEGMKELLLAFLEKRPDIPREKMLFQDFEAFYELLSSPKSLRESSSIWQNFLVKNGLLETNDPALSYDPHDWLKKAFKDYKKKKYSQRVVLAAEAKEDFIHSDWYAFYQAVQNYKDHYKRLITVHRIF